MFHPFDLKQAPPSQTSPDWHAKIEKLTHFLKKIYIVATGEYHVLCSLLVNSDNPCVRSQDHNDEIQHGGAQLLDKILHFLLNFIQKMYNFFVDTWPQRRGKSALVAVSDDCCV